MNDKPNQIRTIEFSNIKIGGETSFPILKPVYILDVSAFDTEKISKGNLSSADILGLSFNIKTLDEIPNAVSTLKNLLPQIAKPLMIKGANNSEIDSELLPALTKNLKTPAIIAFGNENTYKSIVPTVIEGGHILILRSPIDINLAKELNILSSDMGLDLNKILIDTDCGGLGYGFEYGYSIMEKIKLEGLKGDSYLNMPLISFACEESLKAKETKSNTYHSSWGDLKDRTNYFELSAAAGVMAAGADVIVMTNPQNIDVMKGLN